MIFWNLFSCKGTWMIDWVGRLLHLVLRSHDTSCVAVSWHILSLDTSGVFTHVCLLTHVRDDVSCLLTYRCIWYLNISSLLTPILSLDTCTWSSILCKRLDHLSCAHLLIIYLVQTSWSSILCTHHVSCAHLFDHLSCAHVFLDICWLLSVCVMRSAHALPATSKNFKKSDR